MTVVDDGQASSSRRNRQRQTEGATCQQLSRDEIREFFFKEGLIRVDETPCNAFDVSTEVTSDRWAEFARRARH